VAQLAQRLGVSGVAVRRHLSSLAALGLVQSSACAEDDGGGRSPGRPPCGWRVTNAALEQSPSNYDTFALELLSDLVDRDGTPAVDALLGRQVGRLAEHYRGCLDDAGDLSVKVERLAQLRDDAGYAASTRSDDDAIVLTECNCAVFRVAERFPVLCSLELELMQTALGPDVDVQRVSHAMRGDGVCAYRITPVATSRPAAMPAAPA
jgi:DeoR family transcriptional regulator, suf operon transcriptional repressor